MQTKFKQIVTHAGYFHADEVLSIAYLRAIGINAPIFRCYTPDVLMLSDPEILVLDIGRCYSWSNGNFDHHQDAQLPATNMLLLDHFGIPERMGGEAVQERLETILFKRVSDIDTGRLKPDKENPILDFNGMIRAFNPVGEATQQEYDTRFNKALYFASMILNEQIKVAVKYQQDLARWKDLYKQPGIAVCETTDMILCWKDEAAKEHIYLLVAPSLRGGWSVISRDTDLLKLAADADQTFLHASGFMAAYETKELALQYANKAIDEWTWQEDIKEYWAGLNQWSNEKAL